MMDLNFESNIQESKSLRNNLFVSLPLYFSARESVDTAGVTFNPKPKETKMMVNLLRHRRNHRIVHKWKGLSFILIMTGSSFGIKSLLHGRLGLKMIF